MKRISLLFLLSLMGLACPTKAQLLPQSVAVTEGILTNELAVTNANNRISLPAVLTKPAGWDTLRVRPLVVLVAGSGPCDMDETIGPNKPFRDLAQMLAADGIATLRYDKRTRVYGEKTDSVSGARITLDLEYTDDALSALQLAKAQGANRLFLLGHSQGGTMAPRIAAACAAAGAPLQGVILYAAMAREFETVLREQLAYIATLQPGLDANLLANQMLMQLPPDYRLSMAQYDALAAARALPAELPILVMQGGFDYQVTKADFDLWRQTLSAHPAARFAFIPDLDHLFRRLPAKATPASYAKKISVSGDAVTEIVEFVKQ